MTLGEMSQEDRTRLRTEMAAILDAWAERHGISEPAFVLMVKTKDGAVECLNNCGGRAIVQMLRAQATTMERNMAREGRP